MNPNKNYLQPLESISQKSLLYTNTVWSGQPNISYDRSVLENRRKKNINKNIQFIMSSKFMFNIYIIVIMDTNHK